MNKHTPSTKIHEQAEQQSTGSRVFGKVKSRLYLHSAKGFGYCVNHVYCHVRRAIS